MGPNVSAAVFTRYPGSNASWRDTGVNESGFISSDDLLSTNNDFELGTSYLNNAYFMTENSNNSGTSISSSSSNPYAWETGLLRAGRLPPGGFAVCGLCQHLG